MILLTRQVVAGIDAQLFDRGGRVDEGKHQADLPRPKRPKWDALWNAGHQPIVRGETSHPWQ